LFGELADTFIRSSCIEQVSATGSERGHPPEPTGEAFPGFGFVEVDDKLAVLPDTQLICPIRFQRRAAVPANIPSARRNANEVGTISSWGDMVRRRRPLISITIRKNAPVTVISIPPTLNSAIRL
jgi:hypothetical protein